MANDGLDVRCKRFEAAEAERQAMPGLPLLARLDGRAFHTFTRDLRRPYDEAMSRAMIETTRHVVEQMQAAIGYSQSDEITLAWYFPASSPTEYPFSGRYQKLASVLAGMATAKFNAEVARRLPHKAVELPHFDARVWQVPTLTEALEVFIWREDDATKNSLSMAARAHFTDAEVVGKKTADKHELLHRVGVNWNDFPAFFKRGSYLQRRPVSVALSADELAAIPERHRPPGGVVSRHAVLELELPPIRKITNLADVLFTQADPSTGP